MSVFFLGIFNQFKSWIIGAGAIFLVIISVFYKGKRSGRKDVEEQNRKELDKYVKTKKQLKEDIANDSDSDLDDRLREWKVSE